MASGNRKSTGRGVRGVRVWAQQAEPKGPSARPGSVAGEEPIELDERVVTASGFEQRRIDAPASITVLTRGLEASVTLPLGGVASLTGNIPTPGASSAPESQTFHTTSPGVN